MAIVDEICAGWQEVRSGLIKEVESIPADQFGFRPAEGSRGVIEILQHIVETERVLSSEICCDDTNLKRAPLELVAQTCRSCEGGRHRGRDTRTSAQFVE